jgi:hypothetical protein
MVKRHTTGSPVEYRVSTVSDRALASLHRKGSMHLVLTTEEFSEPSSQWHSQSATLCSHWQVQI